MGRVRHGSARTTEAVRRAVQLHQASVRALARRYGVGPTTVQKWCRAADDRGRAHGAEGGAFDGPDARARGDHRRVSQSPRSCRWPTAATACSRPSRT